MVSFSLSFCHTSYSLRNWSGRKVIKICPDRESRKEDLGKAIIVSVSVFTFFFMLIDVSVVGLFGAEVARNFSFPFFNVIRCISIANFLERVETVHISLWILGVYLEVAIFNYLAVLGSAQLLKLKDYKPLVLPLGIIIVSLSILLFENHVEVRTFTGYKIWTPYGFFFLVFLPYVLLLTELVRKKGNQNMS